MKHRVDQSGNEKFEGVRELADAAREILEAAGPNQEKATVAEFPNERTIRYYLTEGLLPPSLEKQGNTSVFGSQHLLSLLAIKKLQSDGLPITLIRQIITGKTEDELRILLGEAIGDEPVDTKSFAADADRRPAQTFTKSVSMAVDASPGDAAPGQTEKNSATQYLEGLLFSRPQTEDLKASFSRQAPPRAAASQPILKSSMEPPTSRSWRREDVAEGLEINIRDDFTPPSGYREMKKLLRRIKDILRCEQTRAAPFDICGCEEKTHSF